MVPRQVNSGDVIAEIDDTGRFVELWHVLDLTITHLGLSPWHVRRAGGKRIEEWNGRRFRFPHHDHEFKTRR